MCALVYNISWCSHQYSVKILGVLTGLHLACHQSFRNEQYWKRVVLEKWTLKKFEIWHSHLKEFRIDCHSNGLWFMVLWLCKANVLLKHDIFTHTHTHTFRKQIHAFLYDEAYFRRRKKATTTQNDQALPSDYFGRKTSRKDNQWRRTLAKRTLELTCSMDVDIKTSSQDMFIQDIQWCLLATTVQKGTPCANQC